MVPPKVRKPRITVVYIGPDGRPTSELKLYSDEEGEKDEPGQ
jgi:hypothetical protein